MTSTTLDTAATTPTQPRSTRRWAALTMLTLAQFLVVLDASIVNIALPAAGRDLGMGTTALSWVITAYVLTFGVLLLPGGRLADRLGHRRMLLTGVVGFALASAAAGLATSGAMLIAARIVQGASAALLAPAALALLTQLFPEPRERGTALGIWGAVAGSGSAAGVLFGGLLTAGFGWPAVFYVNLPIAAIAVIGAARLIRRDPGPRPGIRTPILPVALLRNRAIVAGDLVMLLIGGAMVAMFFALSVFLQQVLGYGALAAGLSQLPLAAALVLAAGAVPAVSAQLGVRGTLAASLIVFAGGLAWLSLASASASFVGGLLGPTLLIGAGLGGAFITTTQLAVDGVPEHDSGFASGLLNTAQQLGGAAGVAVLAAIAAAHTDVMTAAGASPEVALTGGFALLFRIAGGLALGAAAVALTLRERRRA
ncbi:MAG: MFS transporter [Microbacteriaceae bacterium]|nr:MFS transporter [Microbacteriaceae bacterium]MCL2793926.1 MFS transporter [Microbacteriaceae bacterium]